MASKHRKQSASGFYHVYQRGVNLFDIFEDDADRAVFIKLMTHYAAECGVALFAWTLMSDHFHILLKSEFKELSAMMRKLNSVYARHFNKRHDRKGPLFQGRFESVCVENDDQFLTTVRYIHRNPVHHDETALYGTYRWSSYAEYANGIPETCEIDFVLAYFKDSDEMAHFHEKVCDWERHPDTNADGPMKDDEARKLANAVLRETGFAVGISQVGALSHNIRDQAIACVRQSIGCSMRQIQRLTAIAYSIIRKAVNRADLVIPSPSY